MKNTKSEKNQELKVNNIAEKHCENKTKRDLNSRFVEEIFILPDKKPRNTR